MRGDQCWWDWAGIPSWFVAEYNSKYESAALLGRVAGRIAKWQTRATKLASAALEYGVARLPIVTRLRRLCAYLPERCLVRVSFGVSERG